jgi:hypothetical protein
MHLFPLKKAYIFLEAHGLLTEAERIRASTNRFSILRSAMMVAVLQRNALLAKFVTDWWSNGSLPEGRRHLNALARIYERWKKSKEAFGAHDD